MNRNCSHNIYFLCSWGGVAPEDEPAKKTAPADAG